MTSKMYRKGSVWTHFIGTVVVIVMIEAFFDSHFLAWSIGFALLGYMSQIAYVPPARRSVKRFALATTLSGIAAGFVAGVIQYSGW